MPSPSTSCRAHQLAPELLLAASSALERKPVEEALRAWLLSRTVRSLAAAAWEARREPAPPPQAGSLLGLLDILCELTLGPGWLAGAVKIRHRDLSSREEGDKEQAPTGQREEESGGCTTGSSLQACPVH